MSKLTIHEMASREIPIRKYRNGDPESYAFLAEKMTEILQICPVGSFKAVRYENDDAMLGDAFVLTCDNDYEYVCSINGDSNIAALEDLIKLMGRHC